LKIYKNIKRYLRYLPEPIFVLPKVDPSTDLSLSVPLFLSDYHQNKYSGYLSNYNKAFTCPAIWAAMSFIWSSDLGRNGVKVYFHIEDRLQDIVLPYLKKIGVPPKYIRVISLPKQFVCNPDIDCPQLGKKFMWIYDDFLYSSLVAYIDSDIFLCVPEGKIMSMFSEITAEPWMKQNITFMHSTMKYYESWAPKLKAYMTRTMPVKIFEELSHIRKGGDLNNPYTYKNPVDIEKTIFEHLGLNYNLNSKTNSFSSISRRQVCGQFVMMNKNHEFIDCFLSMGHKIYCDEEFMSMYGISKNIVYNSLLTALNTDVMFSTHHFDQKGERYKDRGYFCHYGYYNDNDDISKGETEFYNYIKYVLSPILIWEKQTNPKHVFY